MPDHQETEVKLYVPDLAGVIRQLEEIGATLAKPRVYERNMRYDNTAHTLTPDGIVLRLRQDTRTRLTFKDGDRTITDGIKSRFEAEVEVSDFDTMHLILGKLGFTPYMVYEKYRTTFELDDTEIVLDEMPYGNFVEIEGERQAIEGVLAKLGLEKARRYGASYAVLFDNVRRNLALKVDDLTFENFKGVTVPEGAFQIPQV